MSAPVSWPTVRRYPRSLMEAFPRDHAHAVEHYRPPMGRVSDLARAVVCVIAAIAIGALLAEGCVPIH